MSAVQDSRIEDKIKELGFDVSKMPNHIAVIMDGNGRWAKKKGFFSRIKGHENGVNALRELTTSSAELGIGYLTVYAFSTENWNRPRTEVNALMSLLVGTLKSELPTLQENNIRLNAIGNLSSLPKKAFTELHEVMDETKENNHLVLTLALSYSSKTEILEAVRSIAQEVKDERVLPEDINEKLFEEHLYTNDLPDPDLLIRTSGEYRISNYLLWQIAYAELFFSDTLWPDFTRNDLYTAIANYQKRERRFGKTSEQLKETER